MKLMTQALLKILPPLRSTENINPADRQMIVKFTGGTCIWLACEAKKHPNGDVEFFGYMENCCDASSGGWSYFMLSDLQQLKFPPLNLGVDRDKYFKPTKFSKIKEIHP